MRDLLSLSPSTIAALRTRHVAFLTERLVDDHARGDFVRSFASGYDHLLSQRIRTLVTPTAVVAGLSKIATNEAMRGFVSPIARDISRRVVASLRANDAALGDYVPTDARAAIDQLLARPDLVPEALVRRIAGNEVTEEILRDVLYDGLVEFNESVNPFFADWGLPALIKRLMPIGSGAVLKSMSALRSEFDKRLEPEIRKFLLGFSRKAKFKIADFFVASAGDPKLVALRQSIVAFIYGEALSELTKNVDDDARMDADDAALAVAFEIIGQERTRARVLAELDTFVAEHGDETLGDWLSRIGVAARPELEALGELLWPVVRFALESPPARAFFERVTWDFYATIEPEDVP